MSKSLQQPLYVYGTVLEKQQIKQIKKMIKIMIDESNEKKRRDFGFEKVPAKWISCLRNVKCSSILLALDQRTIKSNSNYQSTN